jgi:hypothetical protein
MTAKILRNAGARVTDDVPRTLVLALYLLGVDRAMVIAHTDCRMATGSEDDVHAAVSEAGGPDTHSLALLVTSDPKATVRADAPARPVVALPHHVSGRIRRTKNGRSRDQTSKRRDADDVATTVAASRADSGILAYTPVQPRWP